MKVKKVNLEYAYQINKLRGYPYGRTKRGAKRVFKDTHRSAVNLILNIFMSSFEAMNDWKRGLALADTDYLHIAR